MDANVRRERPRLGGILLASGLTAVLLAWFGRACWGGWWLASAPTSGDTYMIATIWERWAAQIKDGYFPLWFPEFAGGGHPVHAAWMYGLCYPPLALFLVLPPEAAWTWLAILHLVLGALGMYAFLWDERRDVVAAASGAVVFALSDFAIGRICAGHLNLVMPLAWVPWVLLCLRRVVRGDRGAIAHLALALSMGMLAGHAQVWFYVLPVLAAFAVIEAKKSQRVAETWKPLLAAGGIVAGITAIQWVPAWELFKVSGHPPEDARVVLECSVPASALVGQLAPRLWVSDGVLRHEYSGLGGPLAVAAVLFAFRPRDRSRWLWFGVLALGLVLAMGLHNPVSAFLNDLPPFRFARAPGRALLLAVLAGGVLAGHGVADLVASAGRWRALVPAAFAASALAVGVPWIPTVRSDFYDFDWTKTLPAAAQGHRVNVAGKRYPYPERQGVGTLRDVCPADTPGYRAMTAGHPPWTAWWFDMGAQIEVPWPDGPPSDAMAVSQAAAQTHVSTYEGMGLARLARFERNDLDDAKWADFLATGVRVVRVDDPPFPGGDTQDPPRPRYFDVGDRVAGMRLGPGQIALGYDTPRDAILVVSEKRYPGWRARVDGAEATLHTANGVFTAVEVPGGAHEVKLEYAPRWLWGAIAASVASLLAAVGIVVLSRSAR